MNIAHIIRSRWAILGGGVLLGALIILGIRFATYTHAGIHYHANFGLYVNGQREQFKGAQYYEEEAMCTLSTTITPAGRVHMHDNVNDVVHIEDQAVTWGQFFANLGWTLRPSFIGTPDGTIYANTGASKVHIMLNGQNYTGLGGVSSMVINDRDKLLVSYGNINDAALQEEYKTVPDTAQHYDATPDPESCSGHANTDFTERMGHLF